MIHRLRAFRFSLRFIAPFCDACRAKVFRMEGLRPDMRLGLGVDRRVRMHSMRRLVAEFNVYWWTGAMLLDAARVRQRRRVSERIDQHRRIAGAKTA